MSGDGLPAPVSAGTFPNDNNPNTIQEQDFDHEFYYRGGTFGITRTFDDNTWTQDGFIRSITISVNDLTLFTGSTPNIRVGDYVLFTFSDGLKRRFIYRGTAFTSIAGEFRLAADDRLDIIVSDQGSGNGTYEYFDQRDGRTDTPLGAIGLAANGVVFYNPSGGTQNNPPTGFSWNVHHTGSPVSFGDDSCGGHPEQTSGQYNYTESSFLDCWKANSTMAGYNDYYGTTQYNGDNLRHPDGHSKMVGIAFDGFPIYGPYGYSDPWDNSTAIRPITSSYGIRDTEVTGRPDYGTNSDNPPAGTLIEDFEFIEGAGDLDSHNGRFCITPEFQDGTYAYFLTVDPENVDTPVFPYIMGLTSRIGLNKPANDGANPVTPDTGGGSGGDTVTPETLRFTLQPQNVSINPGQTATFTVTADIIPGAGAVAYQWYRSTDGGFAFAAITGATSASYQVTALAYMTGYKYRCRITGPVGETAAENSPLDSNAVTLTVTGSSGIGDTANRFDSTSSTFDSTAQRYDGT